MLGIILAGGEGMRFSKRGCCKPLLEVDGRYLIEYSLDYLAALGVREVLVVVGRFGGDIAAALGETYCGLSLRYVLQAESKGLMNALYTACAGIRGEDIVLLLSDEVYISPSFPSVRTEEADFLCGYTVPEDPETIRENYAVLCREDGTLLQTVEKPEMVTGDKKGTGFCMFSKACVETLLSAYAANKGAENELCDFINLLISEGKRGLAVKIAEEEININDRKKLLYAARRLSGEGEA